MDIVENDFLLVSLWTFVLTAPVALAFVFWIWMSRQPGLQFEQRTKAWETFVKCVSAYTTIAAGVLIIGKFVFEQQNSLKQEYALKAYELQQKEMEFERERHAKRVKLLNEAASVAATIATQKHASAIADQYRADKELIKRFNQLWFADLIGIEERRGDVEKKMVEFREMLYGQFGQADQNIIDKISAILTREEKAKKAPEGSIEKIAIELSVAVDKEIKKSEENLKEQQRKANEVWEQYRRFLPSQVDSRAVQ